MLTTTFARNLRRIRQQRGLSQESLAALAQVHRTYIGALERGERNPSLKTVDQFADALGIDPIDLFQEINGNGQRDK